MFVPNAPITAVAQTPRPDPQPDPAGAVCAAPNRFARALVLVRKLIDYGVQLASTLTHRTAATDLFAVTRSFSTDDIAEILARIARALHLATSVEDKLIIDAARPERQPPAGPPSSPGRAPAASPKAATAGAGHAAPSVAPGSTAESGLTRMLTAEEIAHQLRHRPLGAVIADICLDLGIGPSHPLSRELFHVMLDHGGNPAGLFATIVKRGSAYFEKCVLKLGLTVQTPLWPPLPLGWSPGAPASGGTGPP
jgi:hypothetical protein